MKVQRKTVTPFGITANKKDYYKAKDGSSSPVFFFCIANQGRKALKKHLILRKMYDIIFSLKKGLMEQSSCVMQFVFLICAGKWEKQKVLQILFCFIETSLMKFDYREDSFFGVQKVSFSFFDKLAIFLGESYEEAKVFQRRR